MKALKHIFSAKKQSAFKGRSQNTPQIDFNGPPLHDFLSGALLRLG
jgi:hypothetical protein